MTEVHGPPADPASVAGGADGPGRVTVARRLGWGVVDQAVSSLSNFALGVYVARSLGAEGFGAFTIAFVTYTVILNASRGLVTDPLMVRYSGAAWRPWRQATESAAGAALALGVVLGLGCLAVGALLPGALGQAFLALGIGLPGLLLQDAWRFAFFAGGRSHLAVVNDLLWTAVLVAGIVVLDRRGDADVFACMLLLGLSAGVAAVFGALQTGVPPRPDRVRAWLDAHRELSGRYLVENVCGSSANQLRSVILGAVAGLATVGHVRGAEILLGPFTVILMGVAQVAVPEVSRVLRHDPSRLARFCLGLAGVHALGAVLWGLGLMLVLPLGPGRALLGDIWASSSPLLLALTVNLVVVCFHMAAAAGLRGLGAAQRSLPTQLGAAALQVIGSAVGAVMGGAEGSCWGLAAANTIGALWWWRQLRLGVRDHVGDPTHSPARGVDAGKPGTAVRGNGWATTTSPMTGGHG